MKKIYLSALALCSLAAVNAQNTDRLTFIEGFTSSTCGPCYSWNNMYSPVLATNNANTGMGGSVAVIKYQMDWPSPGNDPSNNDDADNRRSFYGVSGIPDWFIDGEENDGSQATIDAHNAVPSDCEINAAYTITGNTIDVNVEITPLTYIGGGSRIYIALLNKQYNYNGANGENSFEHVFRKMIGGPGGINPGILDSGVTTTYNESYTYTVAGGTPAQDSYDLWDNDIEIVVWVQKSNSKQVWNAAIAGQGALGIENGDTDDFGLVVYPNPANDVSNVVFDANGEKVTIDVYNNVGQKVLTEEKGILTGRQKAAVNVSELPAGMYYVQVTQGNTAATSPLVIQQ